MRRLAAFMERMRAVMLRRLDLAFPDVDSEPYTQRLLMNQKRVEAALPFHLRHLVKLTNDHEI